MPSLPPSDPALDERLRLIVSSYRRLTGKALLAADSPRPRAGEGQGERGVDEGMTALRAAIWNAPRAIVAHGIEADPVFFYGNRLALQLFEMSFAEFARLPSRLSAEPLAQQARDKLLAKVAQQGYVDNYSGIRIASSGRRFMIEGTTVWNLDDESGVQQGQAAVFVRRK
jgi:hypothetical protein